MIGTLPNNMKFYEIMFIKFKLKKWRILQHWVQKRSIFEEKKNSFKYNHCN